MVKVEFLKYNNSYSFLWIDGYLWMWDTPQERELQKELAENSHGDVLVVGYGLGIVQAYLEKNPNVKSVTSVEKYEEVIQKCKKEFGEVTGEVIITDFYDLLEDKKYDCVIGDIWPDINAKFLKDYLDFKEKSGKILKKGGKILAWGEDYFEYLIEKNNKNSKT